MTVIRKQNELDVILNEMGTFTNLLEMIGKKELVTCP